MVNIESTLPNYEQAMKTIQCYSLHYNYTYILLNEDRFPEFGINCKQKDFMFRRHCLLSNFAQHFEKEIKYIIFIDGDMGVVNPLHRLEEYLPKNEEEVIFYDRTFNYEIMAGSYIIKNNFYSRNFINYFADYEFKVPEGNDGTDNVALQPVFLDLIGATKYVRKYQRCLEIYNKAVGFDQNMILVSCIRHILNLIDETPTDPDYHTYDNGKIKIIRKLSLKRWARDTWLNNWLFCDNDFFHHGWKTEEIVKHSNIFLTKFNSTKEFCKSSNFLQAWDYNMSSKVSCEEVNAKIKLYVESAHNSHLNNLNSSRVLEIS
ncbi:Protein of unknown function DUF273 family-containing protein [Strongyloides ratti]|uniref:Nucleotide-diphospho-sugar transferase family-containing protein n=1 Tax=Strongyloides ratti TaxID=34506 RepID=A0A090LJ47_STRRB|nr:Protein of unknown function DUF273 family-containing protein [Strongyloides ratti]CEF69842.1 Protein of unknown function DUF273 family-containing protein [Strongyloides ratti]